MIGALNVYKPKGITSHDVVSRLRKIFKIKQIGHTGTLDPFAEGVLPICIGKATRLIEYFSDDKEYIATVQFGKSTTTYDIEGEFDFESDIKVEKDLVKKSLEVFEGEILQMPPIYSAIKVNGKKLYDYAREGKPVVIEPRNVYIERIELLSFDEGSQSAEILINCSKGTYIRSIANDLGKNLGCGGYLTKLVRTKAGKFLVKNSVKLENIGEKDLIDLVEIVDLPKLTIDEIEYDKIIHGQFFENKYSNCDDLVILIYNNSIKAVAKIEEGIVKVKKVLI